MNPASTLSVPQPGSAPDDASRASLDELAGRCGATDVMVFRQVQPGRFLQLGGVGRGSGWAGNIELRVDAEAALRAALDGAVVRWEAAEAVAVLGPYYARSAALVPVDHDVVVLMGNPNEALGADDELLRTAARRAVAWVEAVTPAKRLADELEVLTAVRATMHCLPGSLDAALLHVTTSAAEALGCEVGIGWLPTQERLVVVERGWSLAGREQLLTALQALPSIPEAVCRQDSLAAPLPAPLDPAAGIRSHFVLPLAEPAGGLLVLLHTVVTPRGFTGLCRTVGAHVAHAASVVVQCAAMREELQVLVDAAEHAARRDPLTGLLNRLGWQEALDRAEAAVEQGADAAVVVMDLNGLKFVNDSQGHEAGDEFLRRAAAALQGAAREGDVVARLGGDEFAVLAAGAGADQATGLLSRVRAALDGTEPVAGVPLSAAVGAGSCPTSPTLREAFRTADAAMYADKYRLRAVG